MHHGSLQGWQEYDMARWYDKASLFGVASVFGVGVGIAATTPFLHDRIKTDALTVMKSILAK